MRWPREAGDYVGKGGRSTARPVKKYVVELSHWPGPSLTVFFRLLCRTYPFPGVVIFRFLSHAAFPYPFAGVALGQGRLK